MDNGKNGQRTVAKVSAETLALEQLIASLAPGAAITFIEITQRTGIPMDNKNRARLRVAAKRANRIYTAERNVGIVMSHPISVMDITLTGVERIHGCVRRHEQTTATLLQQHGAEMEQTERTICEQALGVQRVLATITANRRRELTGARVVRQKAPAKALPKA